MIGAIVSTAANIISGAIAKNSHRRYADLMAEQSMETPESLTYANELMSNLSTQGIVGLDKIIEKTRNSVPSSLSAIKDVVDNPMAIIGAAQTAEQNVNDKISEYYISDAAAKSENLRKYAEFQSGVIAPWEAKKADFIRERTLGSERERMEGTKEMMQGVISGIGTGLTTYAGEKQNDYLSEYYKSLTDLYKGYSPVSVGASAIKPAGSGVQPSDVVAAAGGASQAPPANPAPTMDIKSSFQSFLDDVIKKATFRNTAPEGFYLNQPIEFNELYGKLKY